MGNRIQMQTWAGYFTYGYDARNQLNLLQDPGNPAFGLAAGRATFTHDARQQLLHALYSNGTSLTVTYDALNRVRIRWFYTASGGILAVPVYSYDSLNRPLTRALSGYLATYAYDPVDQLISEVNSQSHLWTTWTYDAAYHRTLQQVGTTTTSYSYDAADQLTGMLVNGVPTTLSYDPNGSLLSVQSVTGQRTSYTWDASNRLKSVQLTNGGLFTQTYRYDDLRVREDSPVGSNLFKGVQTYLYDGQDVLHWNRSSGQVGQVLAHGEELDKALLQPTSGTADEYQYALDVQGKMLVATNAAGSGVISGGTDAWGTLLGSTSGYANNAFGFCGGLGYWYEPDLNLYYVRARWLNPATGSWLSADPVTSEPLYAYVHNSPTLQVDPSGMQGIDDNEAANTFGNLLLWETWRDAYAPAFRNFQHSRIGRAMAHGASVTHQILSKEAATHTGKSVRDVATWLRNAGVFHPINPIWQWTLRHGLVYNNLAPHNEVELPAYLDGFAQGIVQTLIDTFLPYQALVSAYQFIVQIFQANGPYVWLLLWQYAHKSLNSFMRMFGPHSDPEERGRIAGTLFANIVLVVIDIVEKIGQLLGESLSHVSVLEHLAVEGPTGDVAHMRNEKGSRLNRMIDDAEKKGVADAKERIKREEAKSQVENVASHVAIEREIWDTNSKYPVEYTIDRPADWNTKDGVLTVKAYEERVKLIKRGDIRGRRAVNVAVYRYWVEVNGEKRYYTVAAASIPYSELFDLKGAAKNPSRTVMKSLKRFELTPSDLREFRELNAKIDSPRNPIEYLNEDTAGVHAEALIWLALQKKGIMAEQVVEIYSEIDFCTSRGINCRAFLTRSGLLHKNMRLSHSFFGPGQLQRRLGNLPLPELPQQ